MDGKLLLVTNASDLDAQGIVARYKSLADIECGFRVLKSELEIGPVYHRLPERIRTYAAIGFMAPILHRVMRWRLQAAGTDISPDRALHRLLRIQHHGVRLDAVQPVTGISSISAEQTKVLSALNVRKPVASEQRSNSHSCGGAFACRTSIVTRLTVELRCSQRLPRPLRSALSSSSSSWSAAMASECATSSPPTSIMSAFPAARCMGSPRRAGQMSPDFDRRPRLQEEFKRGLSELGDLRERPSALKETADQICRACNDVPSFRAKPRFSPCDRFIWPRRPVLRPLAPGQRAIVVSNSGRCWFSRHAA